MQSRQQLFSHSHANDNESPVNQQQIYRNTIGGKFILSQNNWTVSLCRDKKAKNTRHAFIIIEGIDSQDEYVLKLAHLVLAKEQKGLLNKLGADFVGTAEIDCLDINSEKLKGRAPGFVHQTWSINRHKAAQLLQAIHADIGKQINYNILGDSKLHSAVNHSQDADNCISWAVSKLANIDLNLEKSWVDMIVVHTNRHIKENNDADFMEQRTSSNCLVM